MNRTSWLRDYFEDYMFRTQRELTGNDGREQTGVGKGAAVERTVRCQFATVFLTLTLKSTATPATTVTETTHEATPFCDTVETHAQNGQAKDRSQKKQACLEFRKDVASPRLVSPICITQMYSL